MDEEIDLRPYLELLIKRWYLIVGAAVLGGLIAFGVTTQQEKVYGATALIAVTQDRLIARFDPRLDTSDEPQPLKVLPEIATSDDMVREVLDTIDPPLSDIETIEGLRGILEAAPGSDPSLIKLTTQHVNPADASRISNHWAAIFVTKANELFGDGDGEQLTFFEDQLSQAAEELSSYESTLVEFQGVNRQTILDNLVNALGVTQQTLLEERQELRQLESSIRDLGNQIADVERGGSPSFADQLTALVLQLRAFNPTLELPLQLQLNGTGSFGDTTLDEQVIILDDLQETVGTRLVEIETELAEIEPQLLDLQEELQEAQSEHNRLQLNRDIAQETYRSLARKVDEERITSDDTTRGIRLASKAAVPEKPEGPRKILVMAIAGIVAAVFVSGLLVFLYWWRSDSIN